MGGVLLQTDSMEPAAQRIMPRPLSNKRQAQASDQNRNSRTVTQATGPNLHAHVSMST